MYRLFCLSDVGTLYQLSSQGWVKTEGTNFTSLRCAVSFLFGVAFVPALPSGAMVDSYIAQVDGSGDIITTWSYGEAREEIEGRI